MSEKEKERRKQKKERKAKKGKKGHHDDDGTGENKASNETSPRDNSENKLDMINNLDSAKLLMISEQFDEYPS